MPYMIAIFALSIALALAGQPQAERDPGAAIHAIEGKSVVDIQASMRAHAMARLADEKAPTVDLRVEMNLVDRAPYGLNGFEVWVVWTVTDTAGNRLGRIEQKNWIPTVYDADNPTWEAAGHAAALGVMKLLKERERNSA